MEPSRKVYSTDHLSPAEQFAFWRESICEAFAALDPVSESGSQRPFASRVERDLALDASLSLVQSQAQRVVRAAAQIRRDPRDRLFVNLMLDGSSCVEQDGMRSRVGAGEVYVVDSTRPYVLDHPEPFRLLCLDLPRTWLPRPRVAFAQVTGGGRAALARGVLRQLREDHALFDDVTRRQALRVACDWLQPLLCALPVPDTNSARGLDDLWQRACRLMDQRLSDPDLDPSALAAALHVSLRYLHEAFAHHGQTVAGALRERRLQRCAEALSSPACRRTVAAIAQDWGFNDVPNFHRRFRARFGVAPGDYRLGRRARAGA